MHAASPTYLTPGRAFWYGDPEYKSRSRSDLDGLLFRKFIDFRSDGQLTQTTPPRSKATTTRKVPRSFLTGIRAEGFDRAWRVPLGFLTRWPRLSTDARNSRVRTACPTIELQRESLRMHDPRAWTNSDDPCFDLARRSSGYPAVRARATGITSTRVSATRASDSSDRRFDASSPGHRHPLIIEFSSS